MTQIRVSEENKRILHQIKTKQDLKSLNDVISHLLSHNKPKHQKKHKKEQLPYMGLFTEEEIKACVQKGDIII